MGHPPKERGGQRWFHLYPAERITSGDPLHWTGPNQNWNYMCADCHSTNLVRNFDLATNSYKTTWSEINVSCETCHGPGSAHVTWAEDRKKRGLTGRDGSSMGLDVEGLRAVDYSGFGVGDASSLASRPVDRKRQQAEVQACAPCHARRGPITAVPDIGRTFLDCYRPAFLEDGLYYPDGQISKRCTSTGRSHRARCTRAGVTCSDCHNAHSLKQRGTGNKRVRPLPPAADLRHPRASSPQTGHRGGAVRQLPYANDHLHGGGSPLRPQLPGAPGGLHPDVRHSQCLHDAMPRRQDREVVE